MSIVAVQNTLPKLHYFAQRLLISIKLASVPQ